MYLHLRHGNLGSTGSAHDGILEWLFLCVTREVTFNAYRGLEGHWILNV